MGGCAVRVASDKEDFFESGGFSCSIVHHGRLRSCGSSRWHEKRFKLFVNGAVWLNDEDNRLATPDETLQHLLLNQDSEGGSLSGQFSYVLFDQLKRIIIIETDLFGVYPIYYCQEYNGDFYAASEIKALNKIKEPVPNLESISEFIRFGTILSDTTFIQGIKKLPAHHRLVYKNKHIKLQNLKIPSFERSIKVCPDYVSELKQSFDRAIGRYASDTDSLSVSLSGGLDSRIATVAAKNLGFSLKAVCCGPPGSLECEVARHFASENKLPIITHEFDGRNFTEWVQKAVWVTEGRVPPGHGHYLDGLFSGHYHSAPQLHGLLGGEIIGGSYDRPDLAHASPEAIKENCMTMLGGYLYWPEGRLAATLEKPVLDVMSQSSERVGHRIFEKIGFSGTYSDYLWFRFHYRGMGLITPTLASQISPWTDPVFPFLDNHFFKLCGAVQLEGVYKKKLQLAWALGCYPAVNTGPRVKDGVLIDLDTYDEKAYERGYKKLRRKNYLKYLTCRMSRGKINLPVRETYPFYDQWYRKWPLIRELFSQTLLSEQSLCRGIWKKEGLVRLQEDLRIGRNVWNVLANIFWVEVFLRQFVDKQDQPSNLLMESRCQ